MKKKGCKFFSENIFYILFSFNDGDNSYYYCYYERKKHCQCLKWHIFQLKTRQFHQLYASNNSQFIIRKNNLVSWPKSDHNSLIYYRIKRWTNGFGDDLDIYLNQELCFDQVREVSLSSSFLSSSSFLFFS